MGAARWTGASRELRRLMQAQQEEERQLLLERDRLGLAGRKRTRQQWQGEQAAATVAAAADGLSLLLQHGQGLLAAQVAASEAGEAPRQPPAEQAEAAALEALCALAVDLPTAASSGATGAAEAALGQLRLHERSFPSRFAAHAAAGAGEPRPPFGSLRRGGSWEGGSGSSLAGSESGCSAASSLWLGGSLPAGAGGNGAQPPAAQPAPAVVSAAHEQERQRQQRLLQKLGRCIELALAKQARQQRQQQQQQQQQQQAAQQYAQGAALHGCSGSMAGCSAPQLAAAVCSTAPPPPLSLATAGALQAAAESASASPIVHLQQQLEDSYRQLASALALAQQQPQQQPQPQMLPPPPQPQQQRAAVPWSHEQAAREAHQLWQAMLPGQALVEAASRQGLHIFKPHQGGHLHVTIQSPVRLVCSGAQPGLVLTKGRAASGSSGVPPAPSRGMRP